jgi:hypothetical protein
MTRTEKLVSLGSEPLGAEVASIPGFMKTYPLGDEVFRMLQLKNGFYAFEQALHVFPVGSDITSTATLEDWNSQTLWRNAYADLTDGLLFFAEDILGDQFCISGIQSGVFRFDSERGETTNIAASIEGWAHKILSDYRVETGWPLANQWQTKHGPLLLGTRLQPKIPFVYGGAYALDNLWAGDSVEGMLFKGEVALKVRDLPEGSQVQMQIKKSAE